MGYAVKEIFYTLQGEGFQCGRPAVFCRFSGCNLWSGREIDRPKAVCQFCDTDFIGVDGTMGGFFKTSELLVNSIASLWPKAFYAERFVVLTGGEPLLQVDQALINELHMNRFLVAVETNGTLKIPVGIDWVCVSPKAEASLVATQGDELKLVYPQKNLRPEKFEGLEFSHFFLQPLADDDTAKNIDLTINYCLKNPKWRLSMQTQKTLGIR